VHTAIAGLLGYLDLRGQVVERIKWASELSGDPLRVQRVRWQRTGSLMADGAYAQALTLMEQVRADLGGELPGMDEPTLSVYASAHLRSAILAARAARVTKGHTRPPMGNRRPSARRGHQAGDRERGYGTTWGVTVDGYFTAKPLRLLFLIAVQS
jgi:hypothetical protein